MNGDTMSIAHRVIIHFKFMAHAYRRVISAARSYAP